MYGCVTSTVCYKSTTLIHSTAIVSHALNNSNSVLCQIRTPTPSSDEDSNASPLPVEKQLVAELSEELKHTETKEEVLKLIPKDVSKCTVIRS